MSNQSSNLPTQVSLITVDVLNKLAQRGPKLTHLLQDFSGLSSFPTKIRYVCFCLSETIFLDNFIKKILNFINGTQMLHLYGTYEQVKSASLLLKWSPTLFLIG